jgi:hypothetical protein
MHDNLRMTRTIVSASVVALAAALAVPAASAPARQRISGTVMVSGCSAKQPRANAVCAPARPLEHAVVVVRTTSGVTVARTTSGVRGAFSVSLANGRYVLRCMPMSGLQAPTPRSIRVAGALAVPASLTLVYQKPSGAPVD